MEHAEMNHLERAPVPRLLGLPTNEAALLSHYTLSDDIEHIRVGSVVTLHPKDR